MSGQDAIYDREEGPGESVCMEDYFYGNGYAAGKAKAHEEVRYWTPGLHDPGCGCNVCLTARSILAAYIEWAEGKGAGSVVLVYDDSIGKYMGHKAVAVFRNPMQLTPDWMDREDLTARDENSGQTGSGSGKENNLEWT